MNQRELFLRHVAQTSDTPMMGIDINIESARGVVLTDKQGKEYIDLIAGISVSNVGHCHPEVLKAIHDQSKKFMHLMVYGEFNQSPQVSYATELCKHLSPTLNCVYYTTGGSEAVEAALKLAKRATGRKEIISFCHAYHGSTHGALSVMGDDTFKTAYQPLLPHVQILPFNDMDALQAISTQTAAVIIEPIQGEAGVRAASHEYLQGLRQLCDRHGVLLIFDEIQSGFGRCGNLFAYQQYGVTPDILLVAKGMGGGLPIGALIASHDLLQCFTNQPILGHINTFGGNAVCVAAAQATLKVILAQRLTARALTIEKLFREHLKHPLIKEIRSKGALMAVEFGDEKTNMAIIKSCLEQGLITDWFLFCPTAMRIAPPLVISNEELLNAIDKINAILDSYQP